MKKAKNESILVHGKMSQRNYSQHTAWASVFKSANKEFDAFYVPSNICVCFNSNLINSESYKFWINNYENDNENTE
ncbi:MAG TPA: hypothetical protein VMX17_10740 [Candidatus Glassbacteria bacterium]|nr:hypothetical protein [Candidatus Glassbacteria bacterium]